MVDTQAAAELQVVLEGVPLPAERRKLIEYARQNDGGRFLGLLESLPDREYRSLDEVGEELVHVQPQPPKELLALPAEESDLPPGGDDYTNSSPESGAVRHDWPEDHPPRKVLEQQTQQQKTQQQRQEQGG